MHGGLLDAEILAHLYLAMTSSQNSFEFSDEKTQQTKAAVQVAIPQKTNSIKVIDATESELKAHQEFLQKIAKKSDACLWQELEEQPT